MPVNPGIVQWYGVNKLEIFPLFLLTTQMTAVITKAGEYKVISATEDSEADTPATKGCVNQDSQDATIRGFSLNLYFSSLHWYALL